MPGTEQDGSLHISAETFSEFRSSKNTEKLEMIKSVYSSFFDFPGPSNTL
jgi:hypothetical protein